MIAALYRGPCTVWTLDVWLRKHHYLGPAPKGWGWADERGCLVLSDTPTSRRLPQDGSWLELSRWCLRGLPNGGSAQWGEVRAFLLAERPEVTTVVSYSDPSAGHTGSLYRSAGWRWAPTWMRLRPPPSGNGAWKKGGVSESVKDRWVDPLREDSRRASLLSVSDRGLMRKMPWASFVDPPVKRGLCRRGLGGGDYARWASEVGA